MKMVLCFTLTVTVCLTCKKKLSNSSSLRLYIFDRNFSFKCEIKCILLIALVNPQLFLYWVFIRRMLTKLFFFLFNFRQRQTSFVTQSELHQIYSFTSVQSVNVFALKKIGFCKTQLVLISSKSSICAMVNLMSDKRVIR